MNLIVAGGYCLSHQDLFQILFVNYASMMLISTILSGAIYIISRHPVAKTAFYYWLSILFGGCTQGFANNDPFLAGLAMLCSTPSAYLLLKLIEEIFSVKLNRKAYVIFWLISTGIGFLLWGFGLPFSWYSAFFTLSVALPVSTNLFRAFSRINKKEFSGYLFWFTCTVWISFLYTYPWLRINQDYSLHALLASFWIGFFAAISLPLILLDQIKTSNARILEQKIAETSLSLVNKNSELQQSERSKTNLLRILCHDIANLISITEFSAKTIIKNIDEASISKILNDEKQIHSFKTAKKRLFSAIETQTELVQNIRQFLAISQGKIKIERTTISLHEAIEKSMELNQLRANQKHITIKYENLHPEVLVLADMNSLVNSVFGNLISNAIKFSFEHSEITIGVSRDLEEKIVEVTITDHGVGISQQKLELIFSEEHATSTVGTKGESGTGFGMPIVKHVCEKMNAKIAITSKPKDENLTDHGTVVTISLRIQ